MDLQIKDIYDNIPFNFPLTSTAIKEYEDNIITLQNSIKEKDAQINDQKEQIDKLNKQIQILARNISILYKTAMEEIQRKNNMIEVLRKDNKS